MAKKLLLTKFQIGSVPQDGQGLRIAVTRRPPRGVPKTEWRGLFDVWLPALAPSAALLKEYEPLGSEDPKLWKRFLAAYEKELLGLADSRQTVALLVELARRGPVSIGCVCSDEGHCHRSRLYEVIEEMGAESEG